MYTQVHWEALKTMSKFPDDETVPAWEYSRIQNSIEGTGPAYFRTNCDTDMNKMPGESGGRPD